MQVDIPTEEMKSETLESMCTLSKSIVSKAALEATMGILATSSASTAAPDTDACIRAAGTSDILVSDAPEAPQPCSLESPAPLVIKESVDEKDRCADAKSVHSEMDEADDCQLDCLISEDVEENVAEEFVTVRLYSARTKIEMHIM
jgi:hypothetical protein